MPDINSQIVRLQEQNKSQQLELTSWQINA